MIIYALTLVKNEALLYIQYIILFKGYTLLHPLVFQRIFPILKMLYILHHAKDDKEYGRGIDILSQMNDERLVHFIHFPQ